MVYLPTCCLIFHGKLCTYSRYRYIIHWVPGLVFHPRFVASQVGKTRMSLKTQQINVVSMLAPPRSRHLERLWCRSHHRRRESPSSGILDRRDLWGSGPCFGWTLGVPMSRPYGNRWDLSGLRAARHPLVPKVRIGVNPKHGSSPGMTGEWLGCLGSRKVGWKEDGKKRFIGMSYCSDNYHDITETWLHSINHQGIENRI